MDYIIIGLVAFYLGFKFNEKIMWFTFGRMMKDAGITNKELDKFLGHWAPELKREVDNIEQPQIEIRLEQHNQTLYAFRKDNDQFLGQGPDQETLFKIIADRFQNEKFVIKQGDGAELLQKNNG